MTIQAAVKDFVSRRTFAIAGVSRSGEKYGNLVFRDLKAKGYKLYPIHPEASTLEGVAVYKDFDSLPEKVDGVILVVPPAQTEKMIREAAAAGGKRVWMQPGAESEAAIQFCEENGILEVYNMCIMVHSGGPG